MVTCVRKTEPLVLLWCAITVAQCKMNGIPCPLINRAGMGVPNGEWSMDKIVYQNHFALESFKTQMTVFNEFCKKYESLEPNVFSKANMLHDEIANALR